MPGHVILMILSPEVAKTRNEKHIGNIYIFINRHVETDI